MSLPTGMPDCISAFQFASAPTVDTEVDRYKNLDPPSSFTADLWHPLHAQCPSGSNTRFYEEYLPGDRSGKLSVVSNQ